jgi:NNP family nitrate/nitrite transporter-like MFS transporter
LRLPVGILADRWGGRRSALASMALTVVPLVLCWRFGRSFELLLFGALSLGIAGASIAIALPLAGRWYPAKHQGLAMGIAGAGNGGTALAALFAPRLAEQIGWQAVFGAALVPLMAAFACFFWLAKDSPRQPPARRLLEYLDALKHVDCWWFAGVYAITFGGFVGLASFLPILFRDQYGLSPVTAGTAAASCVIAGSLLRPLGGFLADRYGGSQVLARLLLLAALVLLGVASAPPLAAMAVLLFLTVSTLGMGNGAVFQLVPNRFPDQVGVITGIVGAAGGLGGFVLPTLLGVMRQGTGSYSVAFLALALAAMISAIALAVRGRAWTMLQVRQQAGT